MHFSNIFECLFLQFAQIRKLNRMNIDVLCEKMQSNPIIGAYIERIFLPSKSYYDDLMLKESRDQMKVTISSFTNKEKQIGTFIKQKHELDSVAWIYRDLSKYSKYVHPQNRNQFSVAKFISNVNHTEKINKTKTREVLLERKYNIPLSIKLSVMREIEGINNERKKQQSALVKKSYQNQPLIKQTENMIKQNNRLAFKKSKKKTVTRSLSYERNKNQNQFHKDNASRKQDQKSDGDLPKKESSLLNEIERGEWPLFNIRRKLSQNKCAHEKIKQFNRRQSEAKGIRKEEDRSSVGHIQNNETKEKRKKNVRKHSILNRGKFKGVFPFSLHNSPIKASGNSTTVVEQC